MDAKGYGSHLQTFKLMSHPLGTQLQIVNCLPRLLASIYRLLNACQERWHGFNNCEMDANSSKHGFCYSPFFAKASAISA